MGRLSRWLKRKGKSKIKEESLAQFLKDWRTPLEPNYKLETQWLRLRIARIAQACGFKRSQIPGNPPEWSFSELMKAGEKKDGWNDLTRKIIEYIEAQKANGRRAS